MRSVPSGCLLAHSLNKALKLCKNEILIAGGQEIYQQTINIATKVYATEIETDFDGDRFFPELQGNWKRTVEARKEEAGIKYEYVYYEKISEQEKIIERLSIMLAGISTVITHKTLPSRS